MYDKVRRSTTISSSEALDFARNGARATAPQVSTDTPEAEPLALDDSGLTSPFNDIALGRLVSKNK